MSTISAAMYMLDDMWRKAEYILRLPGAVVQAPEIEGLYVRHSVDIHCILVSKSGKQTCDLFDGGINICEHSLAAT